MTIRQALHFAAQGGSAVKSAQAVVRKPGRATRPFVPERLDPWKVMSTAAADGKEAFIDALADYDSGIDNALTHVADATGGSVGGAVGSVYDVAQRMRGRDTRGSGSEVGRALGRNAAYVPLTIGAWLAPGLGQARGIANAGTSFRDGNPGTGTAMAAFSVLPAAGPALRGAGRALGVLGNATTAAAPATTGAVGAAGRLATAATPAITTAGKAGRLGQVVRGATKHVAKDFLRGLPVPVGMTYDAYMDNRRLADEYNKQLGAIQ